MSELAPGENNTRRGRDKCRGAFLLPRKEMAARPRSVEFQCQVEKIKLLMQIDGMTMWSVG